MYLRIIDENGLEWTSEENNPEIVSIEMWYDRHRREWVLYPVDAEGNQMSEAHYGFSKKEAIEIKKDMEREYNI